MNTSNDSVIIIEEETCCETISCNCKELMAAITKRQRMEQEHEAIRNNVYISDTDDIDNDDSDNDNGYDDSDTRESYSAKRSRWYLEDQERNDCLQTIWKLDDNLVRLLTHGSNDRPSSPDNSNDSEESYSAAGEELVRFLTHGFEDIPASPESEYSPASPEYETPASPGNESIRRTPDSSPRSPARAWCYACDEEFDYCPCQCPWSPSINYNPCEVCEWEDCKCLKLPIKAKAAIEYITLD